MPWWGWIAIILGAVVAFFASARRSYRTMLRREFRAYLDEHLEDVEIVVEHADRFEMRMGDGEGTINLLNLYTKITEAGASTEEERKEFYEVYAGMIREQQGAEDFSLATHGERILPRVVPAGFVEAMPEKGRPVHRQFEGTGLSVVWVIDSEHSVRYIDEEMRASLGIDAEEIDALGLENLRKTFSGDVVRRAVEEGSMAMVKAMDTFDAARILLIPEHLREGESVAALIPDRDTLCIGPIPPDGDWSGYVKLAKRPASDHLIIDRPIRVTRDGFEVM